MLTPEMVHTQLYFMHLEYLDLLAGPEDLPDQRLRRIIQDECKGLLDSCKIDNPNERAEMIHHSQELINLLLRAKIITEDRRVAQKGIAEARKECEDMEKGLTALRSVAAVLDARSRAAQDNAIEKKTQKKIRAEKRGYIRKIATYIDGTPAMNDLLNEVVKPFIVSLAQRCESELFDPDADLESDSHIQAILFNIQENIRIEFAQLTRELSVPSSAAATVFDRESNKVCLGFTTNHRKLLSARIASRCQRKLESSHRESEYNRSKRLTADSDYSLYKIVPPERHPSKAWSAARAEIESGHYLTVYSGVAFPEQKFAASREDLRKHTRNSSDFVASSHYEVGTWRNSNTEDNYTRVRHANCTAPYAGKKVVVHGVRGRKDLEGLPGDAISFCEISGRYLVQLFDGRRLKLKAVHLCGHSDLNIDGLAQGPCSLCSKRTES